WPRLGLAVVGVFGVASVVFSFVVTYMYDMFTGPANNIDLFLKSPSLMDAKFSEYFLGLYIHPCGRYHVYAIGIFLAYFLYNRKKNTDRVVKGRYNKILFYVGAILAAIFSSLCVFGLNFFGQSLRTTLFASFYNALHHLLFSLSFAWFVYHCATGKLGFFNRMLSARILVPLSRLSYSAYLLHPILMEAYFLSLRAPFQYSHLSLVILNFGFVFVTYMIAFVVTILFGAPFINLERYFRQTQRKIQ
ncbi:Nose resistant to fluoxetine protein 6, partial [Araneus ventricosus]